MVLFVLRSGRVIHPPEGLEGPVLRRGLRPGSLREVECCVLRVEACSRAGPQICVWELPAHSPFGEPGRMTVQLCRALI